jgi:formimidoylglutamate deiminase
MQTIWAEQALTKVGWKRDVRVCIDDGHIVSVEPGRPKEGHITGVLLPAPANVHSHAFQRAMAGLTERRGP